MEAMTLKDWTIFFVKNKDLIHRKLINYENKGDCVLFHFKDKDHIYFIQEELEEKTLVLIKQKCFKTIVCFGIKKNLDFFINHWNELIKIEDLSFIFADPISNNKWVINPKVHGRICDEASLKTGLKTMFENAFPL